MFIENQNATRSSVFHKSGDHNVVWRTGQVALEPREDGKEDRVRLIFEVRSGQLGSEVALDDIQVNYESCNFSCK